MATGGAPTDPWPAGRIAPPPDLPAEVVSLAENSNLHHPLGPGTERVEDPRYVVFLGPGSFAGFTVVQRLRLDPGTVVGTVAEVRALLNGRGRFERTWEIGSSATPPDLTDRLLAMGMVPDREPYAVGMVLDAPPGPGPPDVEVRRVETREEFLACIRVAMESFGMSGGDLEEATARADEDWEALRSSEAVVQFLALIDGEPVAQARATFTPNGVLLNGGATLERARGRGAYRALVRARWDEAERRGAGSLVTQAGAMSRPILARLGFREVCDIRILLDRSDPGAGHPADG
ncbi:MAG: GNAT family N-acetyltransferase [Actinomycetota bacterium]